MSWSTSQLAQIAGTTVKTIRYYHRIGVLAEPERASNGYKQYRVEHLVVLLRILRLTELGMSLGDIMRLEDPGCDPWEQLRLLNTQLEEDIERLSAVRAELAALLEQPRDGRPVVDLPTGMLGLSYDVSDADRSLLLVFARVFDQETMEKVAQLLRGRRKRPAEAEFDALPADADERSRQRLAEDLAPTLAAVTEEQDWTSVFASQASRASQDPGSMAHILSLAFSQLYNRAQLDVLHRVNLLNGVQELSAPPGLGS